MSLPKIDQAAAAETRPANPKNRFCSYVRCVKWCFSGKQRTLEFNALSSGVGIVKIFEIVLTAAMMNVYSLLVEVISKGIWSTGR